MVETTTPASEKYFSPREVQRPSIRLEILTREAYCEGRKDGKKCSIWGLWLPAIQPLLNAGICTLRGCIGSSRVNSLARLMRNEHEVTVSMVCNAHWETWEAKE
jgi:hypothetical protein